MLYLQSKQTVGFHHWSKLHWNHHFAIFNFFYIFRLVWYSNIKNKILRITKYFRIIYIHAIRHAREHISQEKNFKHWQWSTKITHNPWKAKQHTWDPTTNLQKVNEGRKHSASYRVKGDVCSEQPYL
jgi:hypothetical protein